MRPLNLNFFCHSPPLEDGDRDIAWRLRLSSYYAELGLEFTRKAGAPQAPFDSGLCDLVVELKPEVVSFHFGLPEPKLVNG